MDSGFVCFFYREAIYKLRLILKSTNQAIPLDFVILRSCFFFLRPLMESRYSCNAFKKKKKYYLKTDLSKLCALRKIQIGQ